MDLIWPDALQANTVLNHKYQYCRLYTDKNPTRGDGGGGGGGGGRLPVYKQRCVTIFNKVYPLEVIFSGGNCHSAPRYAPAIWIELV